MVHGCEVRRCEPCALVRPRVPCVSRVSRLPGVFFTGNATGGEMNDRFNARSYARDERLGLSIAQLCEPLLIHPFSFLPL